LEKPLQADRLASLRIQARRRYLQEGVAGMSLYVTSYIWDHSQLSGTELLLVLALADQANDEGVCWPSMDTLAHKARMTGRSVQNLMPKLFESGEVVMLREAHGHVSRTYRVVVPARPPRPGRGEKVAPQGASRNGHIQDRRGENVAPLDGSMGEDLSPLASGVKHLSPLEVKVASSGVKVVHAGVKGTTSRGETPFTQTVINRVEPVIENRSMEPSRPRAREIPPDPDGDEKPRATRDEALECCRMWTLSDGRGHHPSCKTRAAAVVDGQSLPVVLHGPPPAPVPRCIRCHRRQDELPPEDKSCANPGWHTAEVQVTREEQVAS